MRLTVNGAPRQLAVGTSVATVVDDLSSSPSGIAVAVNGEVVRRTDWASYVLQDGDRVEVLAAAQGG